ncbi:MAG TPA: MFS transporter [Candidatus Angelobacter sp.]|nr:MFS transporter [Candidatus Angelobacter sp.]
MPKAIWLLIIGMAINVTGSSLLWPLNTIYIHNHLGASLTMAGFLLMLNSAAGIVGNLMGGTLYDRIGGYLSVVIGVAISMGAALLLTFFNSMLPYAIILVVIGFGSGMIFPAMYAMAGSAWPEGGRKPFNALYVSQNLGVAIGASLGGWIASYSFTYTFLTNAILYAVFLVIVLLFYRPIDQAHQQGAVTNVIEQKKVIRQKGPFYALLIICLAFFLGWVAYVQWQSSIASFTQQMGVSLSQYSLLWTVNGLLIVIGQPGVKWVTTRIPSLKAQIMLGISIFAGSYVVLLFAHEFKGFMVAMIVLTLGEMLVWPAVPTIASDLAPKNRMGFYQGFVNSTATAGRMVGPLIGGVVADIFNMHVLFVSLIFVYLIAGVVAYFYDLPLKRATKAPVFEESLQKAD